MSVAENRRRLLEAARSPMPEGFEWDFSCIYTEKPCGAAGCMIGLAKSIGVLGQGWPNTRSFALALDLDHGDVEAICVPESEEPRDGARSNWVPMYGCAWDDITPAMVADKIEELFT